MTDPEQKELERIEKQRREREAALLLLLLGLIYEARRFVGSAIRMGNDPVEPIRKVIFGDAVLHLPGLPGAITGAMADSYAAGYAKVFDLAGVDVLPLYHPGLLDSYKSAAVDVATDVATQLAGIVRQGMADARTAGLRTAAMARAVMLAFTRYGFTRFDPKSVNPLSKGSPGFAAQGIATNVVLTAYGSGMFSGYQSPAVAAKLSGYRHVSVLDHRTSAICRNRDGLVLPKNNPYWFGPSVPPLHNHCRSILLPTFGSQDWSTWLPTVPVDAPWGTGLLPAA